MMNTAPTVVARGYEALATAGMRRSRNPKAPSSLLRLGTLTVNGWSLLQINQVRRSLSTIPNADRTDAA